jgi:hypothetical protein
VACGCALQRAAQRVRALCGACIVLLHDGLVQRRLHPVGVLQLRARTGCGSALLAAAGRRGDARARTRGKAHRTLRRRRRRGARRATAAAALRVRRSAAARRRAPRVRRQRAG